MYKYLIVATLITNAAFAQAVFQLFSAWDALPDNGYRSVYIMGAMDTLSTIAGPDSARAAKHYNDCLVASSMNAGQLSNNVRRYVQNHPKLQGQPVTFGLLEYLVELCGLPR
jgi:hypothetical protein